MKKLIQDYTFDASTKQIAFTGLTAISLEQLLLITNVTDNTIIYSFADPSAGGTTLGNVLTLTYDTTSMSDTDKLQIFIDVEAEDTGMATSELQEETIRLLRWLTKTTTYTRDSSDRAIVSVSSLPQSYNYMRNSGTTMNGNTENLYSVGSWNVVDAREQLTAIQNSVVSVAMQRWRTM